MKILVIIVSNQFQENYVNNISRLNAMLHNNNNNNNITNQVDYAGISSLDDFHHYESVITFKYKKIDLNKQFTKICDFITKDITTDDLLQYDWYIRFRPETYLFENIPFDSLQKNSINARARQYSGPKKIKYGCSVGGKGTFSHIKPCKYDTYEHDIELDDQLYIFDKSVIENGGFSLSFCSEHTTNNQHEDFHNNFWISKNIIRNVIGINMCLMKNNTCSGDI